MVKKLKIGAIIQARVGSTRLPGKVLFRLPLGSEKTLIERIISRAEAAEIFNAVLVATTHATSDDALAALLEEKNLPFFRGSEANVLQRFYLAAKKYELDQIVRLTGDNPCIAPTVLKDLVHFHLAEKNDYTRTTGLPLGMDVEIFSFRALKDAYDNAAKPEEKEHVTTYLHTRPEKFRLGNLAYSFEDKTFRDFRITVDYPSDFALANLLYSQFAENPLFSMQELYDFRKANPWIGEINGSNFQKKTFASLEEEKTEAARILKTYGLENAAALILN